MNALANPEKSNIDFLNNIFCSNDPRKRNAVCCTSIGQQSVYYMDEKEENITIEENLLNKNFCGLQHSDDYIRNDNDTSIDEFPWLALIIHVRVSNGVTYFIPLCSGALINYRYVITSTDCLQKHSNLYLM